MVAAATTVAVFSAEEWAQRLLRLYPNNWTGDSAKVAGGILFSLFQAQSTQYNFLQNGLEWLLHACRVATASDTALDAFAEDYFGNVAKFEARVVRQVGEPDSSFRARIYANLLASGGTRSDVIRVVEMLTGQTPRICEPWSVLDTSACDSMSFLDIDTAVNPCRVGDLSTRYQGFVESILPSFGDQGSNPVYCLDEGLACDRSFIIDPQPTWFLGEKELDLAINRVRMFATIIWRRYGSTLVANYVRGNSANVAADSTSVSVSLSPASSQALSVLACPSWNSQVAVNVHHRGSFSLVFSAPSPGGKADWIAAPVTVPGYGLLYLSADSYEADLAIPIESSVLLVSPSWNTSVWVESMGSGVASFKFDTPSPPGGYLNYGSFDVYHSGNAEIVEDAVSAEVPLPVPIENPYQLIILPSWNTTFSIVKSSSNFVLTFSTPAPADAFISWGILDQPL